MLQSPGAKMPCNLFECAGPTGNKFLKAEIEIVDEDHVNIGFSGRTWLLRNAFDNASIPLAIDEGAEPMRIINGEAGNISDENTMNFILGVFNEEVLRKAPCIVHIVDEIDETAETPVVEFIKYLKDLPHLYFKPQ